MACTNERPDAPATTASNGTDITRRSVDDAIKLASNARAQAFGKTRASLSNDGYSVVAVTTKSTRSSSDTIFYAVNFGNDEGFVFLILGTDMNMMKIVII